MQGAKRLQAEFKYLTKQIAAGKVTQIHNVAPVGDNIFKWQVLHFCVIVINSSTQTTQIHDLSPGGDSIFKWQVCAGNSKKHMHMSLHLSMHMCMHMSMHADAVHRHNRRVTGPDLPHGLVAGVPRLE